MDLWLKTGSLKRCEKPAVQVDAQSEIVNVTVLVENDNNFSSKSSTSAPASDSNKRAVKRKYDEGYLGLGFTWTGSEDYPDALCVVCQKILQNSSVVPAKLKRHLETHHPHLANKSIPFFATKLVGIKAMQRIIHSTTTFNDKLLEVSYLVSQRIAMAGEAHTIAEKLIKPSILDAVKILLGESESKKLESIPLSNNTIDESTDVAGLAVLLAFVRYAYEGDIQEDLLMCKTLPTYTTGEEIFRALDSFMNENEITWGKCMGVCTDGAKSMTGSVKGVVT
uniref:zinc finger BED domain-containing protein 5-like n=1 Tax=Styela clava TaxID=7725 RepID=UPI00193AA419|nr:zinc finger BED domain-containing protein 5-like [Styela clava]